MSIDCVCSVSFVYVSIFTFVVFHYILCFLFFFFFFNDTATTEIYTLSLHDALPIFAGIARTFGLPCEFPESLGRVRGEDRKSTRLNSSHSQISYAVFCLKKKKIKKTKITEINTHTTISITNTIIIPS